MKKAIAITAAVAITAAMLIMHSRSPFGKSNSEFHATPEKEITRIELSQGNERLTLEKSAGVWLINGQTEARRGAVNFIIRILTEAKIKSPVSPEIFKAEITDREAEPVAVKVYEGRKMLKSIMVYKTASNTYGNIMKVKKSTKPFIVHVPGYETNIGPAFNIKPQFWQPHAIFNMLPSEISSIRFENMHDTAASFSIVKKEKTYTLHGNAGQLAGYDPELVIRYVSYFTFIPFESWAFDMPDADRMRLAASSPLYKITVISSEGTRT
ncbi:MAG: hypothetical protein LBV26_06035 [Bacteroidales bacterium]|jgi:hypothetical protein|nr:hypothetical protein [Bacteroidales bacterium]